MDLDTLNAAQRRAVTSADGAHLVVAGAGTGKTRTLVHRVAWLIEQGIVPSSIVLLTFTRRAAREMLDRVAGMVGGRAHGVRGGTFHSFALTTLRQHGSLLGFPPSFTILDRGDAESLVGLVRQELGLGGRDRRFPRRSTVLKILSKAINMGRSVEEIVTAEYPQYSRDAADIEALGQRYRERKQAQGVMDFDDLLVHLSTLLVQHPAARREIAHRARHVLVDEYQDTNRLQARIACLLASVHGNLMVVGDEAQSIYGFRGAAVENIFDFPGLFPKCETTILEENYRSVQPVLDLANGVLGSAARGYDKSLRAVREGGDAPVLVEVADEHAQAAVVVAQVLALREEGTGLSRQAVLFRSGSHANLLEVALTEANIPYRKYGGLRFNEASHVKDVFALLRLVVNPRDVLAWLRVLQWFSGLGAKTAEKIGESIARMDEPRLDPTAYRRRKYSPDLVSLAELLTEADRVRDDIAMTVGLAIRWYKARMVDIYDDHQRRVKDLDTIELIAERYPSVDELLAQVALDPIESSDVDAADHDDEYLTLSTIHSAKGLEWDTVYVLQLADGAFPSGFALDDPDQIEEERRLFYVAVTRAERRLYLVQPQFVRSFRGPAMHPGCVLLDDIRGLSALVDTGRADWSTSIEPDLEPASDEEDALMQRIMGYFDI